MKRLLAFVLVVLTVWGVASCPVLAAPGLDQALFEQALQASRNGDVAEALLLWNRYLDDHPGDAAALSNRGNVRLVLGDALQETELQQIGLHHGFQGGGIFTESRCQGVETHRPTAMPLKQQLQQAAITGIQAPAIHPMQAEGFIHQLGIDHHRRDGIP